jgi:hypothetical protein
MTRQFTPGKLLITFCAALIAVWASLQLVINLRLSDLAKMDGQRVLGWSWPPEKVRYKAEVVSVEVLNRTATDAVVRVKARQTLQRMDEPGDSKGVTFRDTGAASDCLAVLTYYKANRNWILGKVEMQ